ncbi:hypothetical protein FPV67DRAFT_1515445 [Lyophyllum atratum]|nr:hypothetical protein FPV67DRAFT_1515445 [Lyophyllum atratum]
MAMSGVQFRLYLFSGAVLVVDDVRTESEPRKNTGRGERPRRNHQSTQTTPITPKSNKTSLYYLNNLLTHA